ncbi:MAG: arylsulfatase [Armatimonadota bacterium]
MMPQRPNFLVIMTEQHRGDCLSIEDHPVLLTPNMDQIAGSGVRFRRAYSTCPTCIATRRSFLSGQHPDTHGMVGYKSHVEWDAPPTMPQVLGEMGYHTYWAGRSIHQHPPRKRYGFDHMVLGGADGDYREWLERNTGETAGRHFGAGPMHNDWTARPWHLDEELHHTNWTIAQALEFLEKRDPSCPFFLCVSFLAAHPPLTPPAFYMERYLRQEPVEPHIGDWAEPPENRGLGLDIGGTRVQLEGEKLQSARAGYYGLINHVDDQLRRLLSPVVGVRRQTGDNTIVIFTSDHGEMLGDHYMWHKRVPYEGSARVPFLISAPPRFEVDAGRVIDAPVCHEDIMPTVLDMAGADIPDTVEGRSLLPMMQGEEPEWRDDLHIQHAPIHHTLTDGRQKYIWWVNDGREQLFDLVNDPNELHDLAPTAEGKQKLHPWRRRLIEKLRDRPEGFSDGEKLIAGRDFPSALPHAGKVDPNAQRRRIR